MQTPETIKNRGSTTTQTHLYSPQTSPHTHFFGYHVYNQQRSADPIGSKSKKPSFQHADLNAVRRHLDFTGIKTYVYVGDDTIVKVNSPSKIPSPQIKAAYRSLATNLSQQLVLGLSTYSIVLYTLPECDCDSLKTQHQCDHWRLGLIVLEQDLSTADEMAKSFQTSSDYAVLPIKVLIGVFEFTIGSNREYYSRPGPGASISHEDDEGQSATLGGYIRGTRTNRIMGLTVGHMVFDKPMNPNTPISALQPVGGGHRIISPSNQDARDHQMELLNKIKALCPREDKPLIDQFQRKLDDYVSKCRDKYFGETTRAIWQLSQDRIPGIPYPGILDMALVNTHEDRTGRNDLPVPPSENLPTIVLGVGSAKEGENVYKVGRSTGFTEGYISADWQFHTHRDFKRVIAFKGVMARTGHIVEAGDSGALVINERGRVMGMITGGLAAVDRNNRVISEISTATYISSEDILEWASTVLFEEVEFVVSE
jgi:hypothetical protein